MDGGEGEEVKNPIFAKIFSIRIDDLSLRTSAIKLILSVQDFLFVVPHLWIFIVLEQVCYTQEPGFFVFSQ